ncbi:MAG: NAD(P)H oxidoreductase [Prolixibacteraceae bacterium]|jgi:glutathione-regulated potassium-efflux system ancillary protein KefG|nr:NAD(P)H oxidoreductase [Prolixibacteraceae bacterium]MBT6006676.1 NAD(P)H oxidoreductase [Prolixibacteraceae bacterium]MBT6766405.1 NAD(P)H oxidoreductase [Prolixibacteraceae bacterium]MBT6999111.1 NAD(P)H oxidoreductase [Prolixibacteraceae bacterium]MBT7396825.1 NAD(P)H oxidoreductase [Prolixibacteraceae bacterium]
MKKILVIFAHPAFHKSRINKQMIHTIKNIEGVTINNLYEKYPDFFIDVKKEQDLLVEHDIIIWHHPFYWYSSPALLKEWFDLVLQIGFAYGISGQALEGKIAFSVISTGGRKEIYSKTGRNNFTINQFLVPFEQSANLCRMEYFPPFVIHGSHTISHSEIDKHAEKFKNLLIALRDEQIESTKIRSVEYLNELID